MSDNQFRMMDKVKPTLIVTVCLLLAIGTAILKYRYPTHAYFNQGLFLVILLSAFLKDDKFTYAFGALVLGIVLISGWQASNRTTEFSLHLFLTLVALLAGIVVVIYMKRLYHRIAISGKRLKALFKFANEGIILFDTDEKVLLVNAQALKLFGYTESELIGKQLEAFLPERFSEAFHDYRRKFESKADLENSDLVKDILLVKKSGKEFPAEIRLGFYTQQEMLYVVAFIQDLTSQRESENKMVMQNEMLEKITYDIRKMNIELENKVSQRTLILQEALHELEKSQTELSEALNKEKELNEIKSRFVSMASHEFRTPLSTVLSSASLISKYQGSAEQEKREKHIKRIKDSVKHLNDLLEDFLSMGKLEEGRVFTEVVVFDVKDFINEVADEMRLALKEGQQLKVNCEGETHFVTDKRLLKNVLINLLSNAIKFSDPFKSIDVNIDNSGSRMILQIQDKGIGIPEEDLPHLFSTFYRGRNATNIQGTGLGLHIVKRYVNMLEGEITLQSEINEGTTFNIGLPNLQEQAAL